MSSIEHLKELIKNGQFELPQNDGQLLPSSTRQLMEQSKNQNIKTADGQPSFLSSFSDTVGKIIKPKSTMNKIILYTGIAAFAAHAIFGKDGLRDDFKNQAAVPSHYSVGIFDHTGDKNAGTPQEYQEKWIKLNIMPLHDVVKEAIEPEVRKAFEDHKFTENERVNLENRITDLHQKFFGTAMPAPDAVPITPKPKP